MKYNHSELHFKQSNHSIIMCLKEYKIELSPNEEKKPHQITKLAIGKPGGENFSDKNENNL